MIFLFQIAMSQSMIVPSPSNSYVGCIIVEIE